MVHVSVEWRPTIAISLVIWRHGCVSEIQLLHFSMAYWYSVNKRVRKPKGQSQMDNTQTLATLGTHEEVKNKTKTQHGNHQKPWVNPGDRERLSSSCLL